MDVVVKKKTRTHSRQFWYEIKLSDFYKHTDDCVKSKDWSTIDYITMGKCNSHSKRTTKDLICGLIQTRKYLSCEEVRKMTFCCARVIPFSGRMVKRMMIAGRRMIYVNPDGRYHDQEVDSIWSILH